MRRINPHGAYRWMNFFLSVTGTGCYLAPLAHLVGVRLNAILTLPQDPLQAPSIRAKVLLFRDARSLELLQRVERIARTDATVLVVGETGTGKELIARHIHKESGRRGPFLAVNCGALSESLIDAELFGHEAGAFTGAARARAGWFESANGGTLFLDEIGDLSPVLQVKLLRVLQERQVVRLGSTRALGLDVRLVAATNVDLAEAVRGQRFRADLYYRLSVATVALPALRHRGADILALAEHFAGMYCARLAMEPARLSPAARERLCAYSWPGNIRELENAIHRACIVCRDGVITVHDLGLDAGLDRESRAQWLSSPRVSPEDGNADRRYDALRAAVDGHLESGEPRLFHRIQGELVRAAYARCAGNQLQTARALGVSRNSVRTLLRQHGLLDAPAPA